MKVTLAERAANYHRIFPDWPAPRTDDRWLDSVWVLGQNYQADTNLYGAYPPNYLERIMALFPDIDEASKILHLFSGTLPPGIGTRLDIKIQDPLAIFNQPDVLANAEYMPFRDNIFDIVIADPPYGERDAIKYGTKLPNKRTVFEEVCRTLKPGGHLVWLDTRHPMYRKDTWHLWGLIGVVRSTNHAYRFATLWSKCG